MKKGFTLIELMVLITIVGLVATIIIPGCHWCDRASQVVQKELDPQSLLNRYNWYKDAASALDEKQASVDVYEKRFASLKRDYAGQPRIEWAREDREQANLWESEVAGIKASYNQVAAEYNANMAKIQWEFCEIGKVPAGGKPLPRSYKPYTTE